MGILSLLSDECLEQLRQVDNIRRHLMAYTEDMKKKVKAAHGEEKSFPKDKIEDEIKRFNNFVDGDEEAFPASSLVGVKKAKNVVAAQQAQKGEGAGGAPLGGAHGGGGKMGQGGKWGGPGGYGAPPGGDWAAGAAYPCVACGGAPPPGRGF